MNHKKLSKRDSEKLEYLYNTYRVIMYKYAHQILKDKHLAEDAVHQSFVKISENLKKIDEDNDERTKNFLRIVCENTSKDIIKKANTLVPQSDFIETAEYEESESNISTKTPCDILITKETVSEMKVEIDKLPDIYRHVIYLEYFHDYSKKEIAEFLKINYDTVKKRSERARRMLSKVIRKEELI